MTATLAPSTAAVIRPKPRVLGVDLSFASTGLAGNAGPGWTERLKPHAKLRGHERLDFIVNTLLNQYVSGVDLVVIEGPSLGSNTGSAHERAGAWWLFTHALWKRGVPYAVPSPNSLKLYATGMGDANKREVLRSVTVLFPAFDATHRTGIADEADALVLAAMGADWLGVPIVEVPARNRTALAGVQWPDLVAVAA